MKQLIEDYKRRLATVKELITNSIFSGSISDNEKYTRLHTKASEYRTFISDLKKTLNKISEPLVDEMEIIVKRTPNTSEFITYSHVFIIISSDHPRFINGTQLDFGFLNIASKEGYKITLLPE